MGIPNVCNIIVLLLSSAAVTGDRQQEVFEYDMRYETLPRLQKRPEEVSIEKNATFSWTSCDKDTSKYLLVVNNFTLSPDPVITPGNIEISVSITIKKELKSPIQGSVVMEEKAGATWVKLPCMGEFGSCSYKDLCSLFKKVCPKGMSQCNCPFPAGTLPIHHKIYIQKRTPLPGEFRVTLNATAGDGPPIGCYKVTVSVLT